MARGTSLSQSENGYECSECGQPLLTKLNKGIDWFFDNILEPIIYFSLGIGSIGIMDLILMLS